VIANPISCTSVSLPFLTAVELEVGSFWKLAKERKLRAINCSSFCLHTRFPFKKTIPCEQPIASAPGFRILFRAIGRVLEQQYLLNWWPAIYAKFGAIEQSTHY
jgi:hypothetical protein